MRKMLKIDVRLSAGPAEARISLDHFKRAQSGQVGTLIFRESMSQAAIVYYENTTQKMSRA